MKLSSKVRYSVRILLQIAESTKVTPAVKGRTIAAAQEISEAYLEQILIVLKQAGWVRALRGRNGGYTLAVTPDKISVLDIIQVFDGPLELAPCQEKGDNCGRKPLCPSTFVWQKLAGVLREEAAKHTIQELMELVAKDGGQEYVI